LAAAIVVGGHARVYDAGMSGKDEVDAHIARLDEPKRSVMNQLRELMTSSVPDATEVIAYKMPSLRLGGRYFMSYEAFRDHYSVFPGTYLMTMELGDEIEPYMKGKGTLQFSAKEPLPVDLIRKVIQTRLRDFR
jgi:uncharacterized protein YdhG (YjbR/CyaY superfamily)